MNLTIDGCIKITKEGQPAAYALHGTNPTFWQHSEDSIITPIYGAKIELCADDPRDPINVAQMLAAEATAQGFVITPEVLAGPAIHRTYGLLAAEYDPFSAESMNCIGGALKEIRKLMRDPQPIETEQGAEDETE